MHSGMFNLVGKQAAFLSAPDYAANRTWPWRKRIASAAKRRWKAWLNPSNPNRRSAVEGAIAWLNARANENGLSSRAGAPPCPGTTAAIIPTLLTFGQLDLARRCCSWLVSIQQTDGSFPQAGGNTASVFNTAQALAALIELTNANVVTVTAAAHRAADYVNARLEADLAHPLIDVGNSGKHRHRAAIQLSVLPFLVAAARMFDQPTWHRTAECVAARSCRAIDWHAWSGSGRLLAHAVDALLAPGKTELASEALCWPNATQRKSGPIPGDSLGRWGDNELLAHLAVIWYRIGNRQRADQAMAFLRTQQLATGGWSQYWGGHTAVGESSWTVKHFLDAAWLQVETSFDDTSCDLPDAINPQDCRYVAVQEWVATLGPTPTVADVGCGPGRFLRQLVESFPHSRFVGIDPSSTLLNRVAPGVETRIGSLLRIPARDGEFDDAFAVESLEHSLLPERAVSELCRVVRPGGRVLIIDKHAARQRLSLHEPWERWFLPETIARWLAPFCGDIHIRPIAHGPCSEKGLFLAWEATRLR
jgi:malonyl-CoA O-methyltransferase